MCVCVGGGIFLLEKRRAHRKDTGSHDGSEKGIFCAIYPSKSPFL